jgi:hypothetical protein
MSIHNHNWRCAVAFLSAAVALFLVSFAGAQALSIRVSFDDLDAASQAILRGRVERIESAYTADGQIESTVYVRAGRALRGLLGEGSVIPVRIVGGTVDGLSMASSEEAVFAPDEEVYLFLARVDGAYRVAAGKQGKFEVLGDRAVNRAWGRAYRLRDLEAAALEGGWPPESAGESTTSAPEAAAAPDNYVYKERR